MLVVVAEVVLVNQVVDLVELLDLVVEQQVDQMVIQLLQQEQLILVVAEVVEAKVVLMHLQEQVLEALVVVDQLIQETQLQQKMVVLIWVVELDQIVLLVEVV
jgi:hypothetical protein